MKVEHIGPESLIRNFRRTLTYHLEGTARLLPFEMRGVISWNNRENRIARTTHMTAHRNNERTIAIRSAQPRGTRSQVITSSRPAQPNAMSLSIETTGNRSPHRSVAVYLFTKSVRSMGLSRQPQGFEQKFQA